MQSKPMSNDKRALAILRISSKRQEDGYSHDLQEQETRAYASREGLEIVDIVRIVESAKFSEDRRKYQAAIDKLLKEKIGNLLFYQQDREARNNSDLERNENYVLAGRFSIHYVRDRKVLHKDSPSSDFLTRDFQGVINKQYSRNLSVKVQDAMKHKAESGWYPSNNPPFGYRTQPILNDEGHAKKRGTIIVPDADPLVRSLVMLEYELRAKGLSVGSIRRTMLDEARVPERYRSRYTLNNLEARLKSPFYRGKFVWQGIEYPGKHDLFVPLSVVEAVDRTFGLRGFTARPSGTAMFAGWLKCGVDGCGCQLTFDPKLKVLSNGETRSYAYYRCTNGKNVHLTLRGMNVKEDQIFERFGSALDSITISESFAKEVADALNETHLRSREALEREIIVEQERGRGIENKIAELTEWALEGKIDHETFKISQAKFAKTKRQSEERQRTLTLQCHDSGMETAKSILELATQAKSLWLSRSPQERRDFLDLILSNPLWDGVNLRYDLKKPFRVLSEMRENEKWRTQRADFRTECADLKTKTFSLIRL